MSSLQAIFDQAPPYTRAQYMIAGVTYAELVRLPPSATETPEGASDPPDPSRPHFLLRLLQGSEMRDLVVTAQEVALHLAGYTPSIPIQQGWTLDSPSGEDAPPENNR